MLVGVSAVLLLAVSSSLQVLAAPSPHLNPQQSQYDLSRLIPSMHSAKRAMMAPGGRIPMYERPVESKELDMDPALQTMSTSDIYRMLEVLDMIESKKTEKLTLKDMDTLKYLLDVYQQ